MDNIDFIHSLGRFSGKVGLHRINSLLSAIGNPQKQLKFIHIAGTNGKGSTATITAKILQNAGYKVGLFTSPFIIKFNERITINSTQISDEDLNNLVYEVKTAMLSLKLPESESIGEFEFITAVAMLYFARNSCDIVALEVGLGGEFDATNAIDTPIVSAITSISLDHTAVLGNSIREIASTKAGIIKPCGTVVCAYDQHIDTQDVIKSKCKQQNAKLYIATKPDNIEIHDDFSIFTCENISYKISLIGEHQVQNACTALTIINCLNKIDFKISQDDISSALENVRFIARLEHVSTNPRILIDGAHNQDGINSICKVIKNLNVQLIIGMVADKSVDECVSQIAPMAQNIFCVQPNNERALDAKKLADIAKRYNNNVKYYYDLSQAINDAIKYSNENDTIIATGSLYLMGDIKKIIASNLT